LPRFGGSRRSIRPRSAGGRHEDSGPVRSSALSPRRRNRQGSRRSARSASWNPGGEEIPLARMMVPERDVASVAVTAQELGELSAVPAGRALMEFQVDAVDAGPQLGGNRREAFVFRSLAIELEQPAPLDRVADEEFVERDGLDLDSACPFRDVAGK